MRNILALAAAALLIFAALGWYLDWYKIKAVPSAEGQEKVTIDINGPKIGEDLREGKAKLRNILDTKGPAKNTPTAENTTPTAAPAPPPPSAVVNFTPAPAPAPYRHPHGNPFNTPPAPAPSTQRNDTPDDSVFVLPGDTPGRAPALAPSQTSVSPPLPPPGY